jgi:predicted nucleic acid-binding protein
VPVVDASVVVDWVAPRTPRDSSSMRALGRLAAGPVELVAPRLLLEEVANALITGIRRRRWTGVEADAAFARMQSLPVKLVDTPADLERAYELARRFDEHPLYDMLYVAVAERRQTTLVTADDRLRSRLATLTWVLAPDDA